MRENVTSLFPFSSSFDMTTSQGRLKVNQERGTKDRVVPYPTKRRKLQAPSLYIVFLFHKEREI